MDTVEAVDREALRTVGTMLRFVRSVEQRLRRVSGSGLSLTELAVLGQIERGADLPSLVARELQLDPPRVTRLTDRLVSLRYLERASDPEDRRRCRLTLTEAGRDQLQQGMRTTSQVVESILAVLGPEERAALLHGLEAVRPVVEA